MRELGLRSYMVVPMVARGRSHGAITLVSAESGRRYEETDLRLAEELARRAALAVDNAKLYEEAQREIAERRDAEEALLQSEGRYRTVVKQAAEGIFVVDMDTKLILEANIAYRNLLGYTAQDMLGLGLTLYDVVAHDRKSIDLYLEQIQEEGVHFIGERRHRRKDGSLVDVEVSSSVISYGGGEALCVIVHDITERKRSAERLQRSLDALLGLYEAGQILSSSLEREEIGSRLLEIASRVSNLTAAVIAVPSEDGELRIWRSAGLEGLWRQVRFSPEALAARQKVLETRKYQTVQLRQPGDADGPHLVSLNLPLLVRGRLIGVLEAYGPEALMERQYEETLISLANQGASALENARLYAELAERENRLQDLIRKLITAQEEERRKVSYEVHDGLAQTAAGAHQILQAFARQHPPDSEKGRKDLARALQLVQQTVGEARYVIADLRPTALDDFGLAAAVRLQVEKISSEGSQVDYEEALGNDRLPPEVETALFRVAQEALTNVHKHAPSARVKITLRRLNDAVRLQVRDWGPGFNPEKITDGGGPGERLGLSSMRERVALLGGHLEVHSKPGEGTEVVAEIPSVQIDGKGR
jgi:PAS domain S-box-containing protein